MYKMCFRFRNFGCKRVLKVHVHLRDATRTCMKDVILVLRVVVLCSYLKKSVHVYVHTTTKIHKFSYTHTNRKYN